MKRVAYRDRNYAFGQTMLALRTATGLTQTHLADYLGVARETVGAWEAGSKYPKPDHLKALIELALKHEAFPAGSEEAEIRALWQAAQQKVLLNESWLADLLGRQPEPTPPAEPISAPAAPPEPAPLPLPSREPRLAFSLPFQPTPLFGREAELDEIIGILRDPACRLLTLVGAGGIGKTRLALEIAARQTGAYPDGIAFVALASISTPNQIVSAIGEALDLSFTGQSDPAANLLRSLRDRQMMLVLDNFEHLLDGADLVNEIIQRAPDIVLLITSQVRLDLQAEWLFNVEGLAYPPGDKAAEQPDPASYGAVQLFVQRATQMQPRFVPSEAALATIVSICQEVEGMPLAIELAAASLRTHTLQEIERQIHGNLDALSTTLRDVPPRHRSLRAVFDHAWNLLSEPERVTFSRQAVFHGGCTAEAAKQVAGAALPALLALMDKSLLRQGTPSSDILEPRFLLLEPIREYALEKLAERGETAAILRAHAAYYLALAESAAAQWDTPTADEAIAQLDREHDNLRAVLQWARDGGDVTVGLQLAYALTRFWRTRGYIAEGRYWLADLLALDAETPDPVAMTARMRALHRAGWLAADQYDFTHAAQLFGESAALRRALGETEGEATLLINAALQARAAGEYQRATLLLEDALSQQRAQGDRGTVSSGGFGFTLYALALVLREQGHFDQAQSLLQECMDFHAGVGESEGVAQAKMGLADVARDQGDAAQMRRYSAESLAVFRDLGTQWAIGFTLNNLAQAAYLDGDLQQALSLATESESLFRSIENEGGRAEVLVTLGHIHRAYGNVPAAREALKEALRIAQVVGPRVLVAAALEGFGTVLAQTEQADVSVQLISAAAALRAKMGTPMRSADQLALEGALEAAHAHVGDSAYVVLWADGRAHLDAILRRLFA